ncbi:unnamed protein product [Echinostoma caproni]|uniref:DDE-1 domain-containing protein n=1 Tax=Echinostoma caproni TaxID=27848 RepID=A0A183B2E9_9TREM|nr:unnamed protein product [Echinostoma caproni]
MPKKLRIVLDCAAKHKGKSLNDMLYQGSDTTATLVGILLRFRKERVAVTAGIEEMFIQVKVPKNARGALRFLCWVLPQTAEFCPFHSRFGWLGPAEGLGFTPTMDNLAPAMAVGRGCNHRLDYMRPHSGPG